MRIKGAVMLARQMEITSRFGKERWESFLAEFSSHQERFEDAFFLTSRIPIESFLEFQEGLIEAFYGGDERQYLESGRSAARWAFTEGPYMRIVDELGRDLHKLLSTVPARMWEGYFDFGRLTVRMAGARIEATIEGLPSRHPYFTLSVPGFMLGTLEVLGVAGVSYEEVEIDVPGTIRWLFTMPGNGAHGSGGG